MQNDYHNSTKNVNGLSILTPQSITFTVDKTVFDFHHYTFKIVETNQEEKHLFSIFGFKFGSIPKSTFYTLYYCCPTQKIDFIDFSEFLSLDNEEQYQTIFTWQKIAIWNQNSDFNLALFTSLKEHIKDDKLQYWFEKLSK